MLKTSVGGCQSTQSQPVLTCYPEQNGVIWEELLSFPAVHKGLDFLMKEQIQLNLLLLKVNTDQMLNESMNKEHMSKTN